MISMMFSLYSACADEFLGPTNLRLAVKYRPLPSLHMSYTASAQAYSSHIFQSVKQFKVIPGPIDPGRVDTLPRVAYVMGSQIIRTR